MYEDQSPIGELVHLYVDGAFGRRELLERVVQLTGSMAAAVVALGGYEVMKAQATPVPPGVLVPEDDPSISSAGDVTYGGLGGALYGYLVTPKVALTAQQPGVIVIHENRGLLEHHKDVARRAAKAGFVALAIDLLSRQGGTAQFADATAQSAAYGRTTLPERRADLIASLDFLKKQEATTIHNRIGVVGFCAGGGNLWDLIVYAPEIAAAVPFYGTPVVADADVPKIQTPVLCIYAETDRNLTRTMQATASVFSQQSKTYALRVYQGAGHAFHNDTGAAYNATAAVDAWGQTMAFFNQWLRR